MRELCQMHNVNAFALRRRILKTKEDSSNWDLIRKFCYQDLPNIEGVEELFAQYWVLYNHT